MEGGCRVRRKNCEEYEKELEAQMKEIDVVPSEEDKEDETAVSEFRWKELWSDCSNSCVRSRESPKYWMNRTGSKLGG